MAAITTQTPNPSDKVALDTEGAAYLSEEILTPVDNHPLPAETYMPESAEDTEVAEATTKRRSKIVKLAVVAGIVLLLVAGIAAYFLTRPASPPPEPEVEKVEKPEVIVVPSTPDSPATPQEITTTFEPFWVVVSDGKGGEVFLTAKFAVISRNQETPAELERSKLLLRDAIYFYLKNQNASYLSDARNYDTIKKELASVLDGYLRTGHVEDMLFESYLSQ